MKKHLLVVVSVVGCALALSACPGRFGSREPGKHVDWMAKKISRELSLRPEQEVQLQALAVDVKAHMQEKQAKMQQRLAAARAELQKDPLDVDAMAALAKAAVRERESVEALDAFIDRVGVLAKTLDVAQQKQLRETLLDHLPD